MARVRDTKAEYARRKARGAERGLSGPQMRGHARHNEAPVKPRLQAAEARLERGLSGLHKTGSLTKAAKSAGISSERLRRFLLQNGYAERAGRTYRVTDPRLPQVLTFADGEAKRIVLRDRDQASINGTFMNAVRKYVRSNRYDLIRPFIGTSIIDAKGNAHLLETDRNTLHELVNVQDNYVDVYRLVQK